MHYRAIEPHAIDRSLFEGFVRRQDVVLCRRRRNDAWVVEADPFVDDWGEQDYRELIAHLRDIAERGGFVFGAFDENGLLKGFVSVDSAPFGETTSYLDLCDLYVSAEMRKGGIGRRLFEAARAWARNRGADALYLSAHSAVESQAFYEAMGCIDARHVSRRHIEKEPYDCQLECPL